LCILIFKFLNSVKHVLSSDIDSDVDIIFMFLLYIVANRFSAL